MSELRTRIRLAWAVLRGHSVMYRVSVNGSVSLPGPAVLSDVTVTRDTSGSDAIHLAILSEPA